MRTVAAQCPKRMVFGPCGGVRADGGCEMVPVPCVFAEPVVPAAGEAVRGVPVRDVPLVLTDVSSPPFDLAGLTRIAGMLAGSCDAGLVGEHHNRPDHPPSIVATTLLDAGVRPWITLACRDRNRIVMEQELRGLAHLGVDTVLCVTGDGRGPDVRADVTQVWDLDGPRLATLATEVGLSAAVPETPTAPPSHLRARRLIGKQHQGAAVAVLNHVREPADVARFVADARAGGLTIPVLAAVATFTDEGSAAALANLPGLELAPHVVSRVLAASDPVEAGIAAAVDEARALLAVDGIDGVNVSGLGSMRGWDVATQVKAEVGRRIHEELGR